MNKVIPKGKDLFSDRGPSICMFTTNNLTGEHIKKIREDKRTTAEIAKAYEKYNLVSEKLIKDIRTKSTKKSLRSDYI